jgi:uncharacterized protein (TIGR02145 family)
MKQLGYIIACFVIIFNVQLVKAQGDVKIGTQVWTSKNLDVSTFRNGEAIPEVKSKEEWVKAGENKQAAWCYYDNDSKNGKVYGKLYNWYAVTDSRGLAPKGYHIPSDAECTVLTDFLGGDNKAGEKIKSKTGWQKNGNGTNSSGFNALPGGARNTNGTFTSIGKYGSWWSSTEGSTGFAWSRYLGYLDGSVGRGSDDRREGFSVVCLRD